MDVWNVREKLWEKLRNPRTLGEMFFVTRNPQLFFVWQNTPQQNTSQHHKIRYETTPHVSPKNGRSRHRGEGALGLALRGFGPTGTGTAERWEHCGGGAARGTARSTNCRASWFPPTSSVFLCLRASCVFASKVDNVRMFLCSFFYRKKGDLHRFVHFFRYLGCFFSCVLFFFFKDV